MIKSEIRHDFIFFFVPEGKNNAYQEYLKPKLSTSLYWINES